MDTWRSELRASKIIKKIFYCKKIDSDKSQCKNSDYSVGGDFHPVLRRGGQRGH